MPLYSAALVASLALGGLPLVLACNGSSSMPSPSGTFSNSEPIEVGEGEVFDGEMALYDRGAGACSEQDEGGESDTVFILRPGSTLRNVIIGKDQAEGVYCIGGGCTIENVWFEDVCEDAISIKEDPAGAVTNIIGGGAFSASDKIIQHNGCGTVNIQDFYAEDYGKVYRSCGTCEMCKRTVNVSGVTASGGGEIVGINIESGDEAALENICTDHEPACQLYDGPGDKAGSC